MVTDHNNLHWFLHSFINTKSLNSRQVRRAQELSRYHFQIDYRRGKANGAADALSRFPQRSQGEEEALQVENTQILHRLQTSLTNASSSGFMTDFSPSGLSLSSLTLLHQVLIYGTHVLPQLRQLLTTLRIELADNGLY